MNTGRRALRTGRTNSIPILAAFLVLAFVSGNEAADDVVGKYSVIEYREIKIDGYGKHKETVAGLLELQGNQFLSYTDGGGNILTGSYRVVEKGKALQFVLSFKARKALRVMLEGWVPSPSLITDGKTKIEKIKVEEIILPESPAREGKLKEMKIIVKGVVKGRLDGWLATKRFTFKSRIRILNKLEEHPAPDPPGSR